MINLIRTVEELREKTWELDTSTRSFEQRIKSYNLSIRFRNNLVFYGLKEENLCANNAEWMVKEVLKGYSSSSQTWF